MREKISCVSSFFWPYTNANGFVISKKMYNLAKSSNYKIDIYTYLFSYQTENIEFLEKNKKFEKIYYIVEMPSNLISRIIKLLKKAQKVNEVPKIIVSYHHLFETAYFTFYLKKRYKTKWVAIYSDPPLYMSKFTEEITIKAKLGYLLNEVLPNHIIKNYADKLVFNDVWQARFILGKQYKKYEHKVFINQMGYDEEFLNKSQFSPENASRKIQLAYFGNLYGPRSGKEFVYAVKKMLEKQQNIEFEIHIYGNNKNAEIRTIIDSDKMLQSIFYLHDQIGYQQSIDKMQQADILLVLDADLSDRTDIYPYTPSKIIDYISVKKPIFGISMKNSPTRDICEDTKNWWSSFDEQQICDTFLDCLQNYENHQYDEEVYYKYSLNHQNELFDEMLQSLMNEKE